MIQFHKSYPYRTLQHQPRSAQPCQSWGSSHGEKRYSLEVIQNPIRARQCGFGDKDRRPLAPAVVAKLVVRREDGSLVDVDDIDTSFFVAAVDLWDETGQYEMNLVLHPSSDRNNSAKPSSKPKAINPSHSRISIRPSVPTAQDTPPPGTVLPRASQPNVIPEDKSVLDQYQNCVAEPGQTTWGYGPPVPMAYSLPSAATPLTSSQSPDPPTDQSPFPPWSISSSSSFDQTVIDPAVTAVAIVPSENGLDESWSTPTQPPQTQTVSDAPSSVDAPLTSAEPVTHPRKKHTALSRPSISHKDATYTRTLMGPLSSPAYRLLDQHRQPGIFFLFQDLSIRTEGTFRLRMRLMNVGAPPAPEAGSTRVTDSVSPILAQTFTLPFTIYSAKRFPGVPDTTALSIAFGNQGMKIPLRNRHGKRQRDASDDDSS